MKDGYKMTELGGIPVDWEIKFLHNLGVFTKGKGLSKKELVNQGIPCVRYGEIYTVHDTIIKRYYSFIDKSLTESSVRLKRNDILFAGSGETAEEIGKAVAHISDDEVYAGGDIVIFSPDMVSSTFLAYCLNNSLVTSQRKKFGQGNAVVHIYARDLGKLRIPIPPLPEQQKIATILSTVDEKIDVIDAQITQTKELKKGLMQKLLTRGIGHTKFKDSVLGEIPESWEVLSLDQLAIVKGRLGFRGYTKADLVQPGEGALTIGATQISKSYNLDFKNPEYISWEKYEESPEIKVEIGQILMVQRGSIGKVALVRDLPEPATINPSMVIVRDINCSKEFLFYILSGEAIQKKLVDITTSTAIPMITQKQIKEFCIPVPSFSEQVQIAEVLTIVYGKLDTLNAKKEAFQELKKGLMQQLLTGKVRVV